MTILDVEIREIEKEAIKRIELIMESDLEDRGRLLLIQCEIEDCRSGVNNSVVLYDIESHEMALPF
jgi:hypothetical protein